MWKQHGLSLTIVALILAGVQPVQAQIVPDRTLGSERSSLTQNVQIRGGLGDQINGGAIRGSNLFHSFSEFNVSQGQRVYFANPIGIQTILTRITGKNSTNINGTLGVDGGANLFVINPNGIVFGQNAQLEIRGSFIATTASAVQFGIQGEFSTTQPQAAPLLTVQPSALLFQHLPASIELQPNASLEVLSGRTIALVGGNLNFNQAAINAPSGTIVLGAVGSPTRVELNGLKVSFSDGERGDIAIAQSRLNVAANPGGRIEVQARNFDLSGSSLLNGGIVANAGDSETQAGEINIQATGSTTIRQSSAIHTSLESGAKGNSGNVTINTGSLFITDAGFVLTAVNGGIGKAGDITLNVQGASVFNGQGSDVGSAIFSVDRTGVYTGPNQIASLGIGTTGKVSITTGSLAIINGAQLLTSIVSAIGKAGDVTINARDAVELDGVGTGTGSYENGSTGVAEAGDIYIAANSLRVTNNAQIATLTSTLNQPEKKSGNITIETSGKGITLSNDAAVGSFGFGGNAGDVNLASPLITLTNGAIISSFGIQGNAGDINLASRSIALDNGSIVAPTFGQGNAGKISLVAQNQVSLNQSAITTSIYSVQDLVQFLTKTGATLNYSPDEIQQALAVYGSGGKSNDINVTAGSLRLDNNSFISSDTSSGGSGNIRVQLREALLLRRSSKISTTAGALSSTAGSLNLSGGGDGGNITISSPLIIAVPEEASKISANAFSGSGGKVNISTEGLFGIQVRPRSTIASDITASSQQGVQGIVSIAQPNVQPMQGTIELPSRPIPGNQLVQACPRGTAQKLGSFVVSGRGSAPPNPIDPMSGSTPISSLATIEPSPLTAVRLPNRLPDILEAQGWIKSPTGIVQLVTHPPTLTPSAIPTAIACPPAKQS